MTDPDHPPAELPPVEPAQSPTPNGDRVLENKDFSVGKLREAAAPSSPEADAFAKLLRAARQKEELGRPNDEVISAYLEATAACPTRAEALHGAARFCRNKGLHERGYEFAAQGLAIAYPKDAPALEDWIYEYGLLDELAVNAYWSGHNRDCLDACLKILATGKFSGADMQRVVANARFASERLALDDLGQREQEIPTMSSHSTTEESSAERVAKAASKRVAIGIPTYNRRGLVEACGVSLCSAVGVHDAEIIVIDDCSSEFDIEFLRGVFPKGASIARRETNSGGADYALYKMLKTLLETGADILIVLDSDMIVSRDFIDRAVALLPKTDGLLSLYNSHKHLGVHACESLMLKNSIGAAGSAWSKELLSELIANVPFETYYDWAFSRYIVKTGKRIMSVRNSCVQHTGLSEGQHAASFLQTDFGIGFVDYHGSNLAVMLDLIVFGFRKELLATNAEVERLREETRQKVV
jgi:hypothetical protein